MTAEHQNGMQCNEFDALLSDALDHTLSGAKLESFRAHAGSCAICGPLFAEAGRREFVAIPEKSLVGWDEADEAVTALAASILAADGPRVSFVYLGAVDAVGHVLGAGAAYREAARAADQRVGRLLAAVRSRPSFAAEDWTAVVVTDHGHLDQGGHGGREPEVATAWAAPPDRASSRATKRSSPARSRSRPSSSLRSAI